MPSSIKWDKKALKRLEKAFNDKRFKDIARKHLKQATIKNGLMASAHIRKYIQTNSDLEPNAALTREIKRSAKPLVDKGDFWQSITFKATDTLSVFVGILATDGNYNIGMALHDGTAIKVSDKMRSMFKALWFASQSGDGSGLTGAAAALWARKPGGWLPLKQSTSVIIIKARPFIDNAFADGTIHKKAIENWTVSLEAAMKELAGG